MVSVGGLPVTQAGQALRMGRATYDQSRGNWASRDASVLAAPFNILDEGVREGLATEVGTSVPAERAQDFHSPVHRITLSHNINLPQACHAEEASVSFENMHRPLDEETDRTLR